MKRISLVIALMLIFASIAQAVVVVRQHSATIQPGLKILASDLSDEFNNLVTGVNNIDSTNVTNGSLTQVNFAASSNAIAINKRYGCRIRNILPVVESPAGISISSPQIAIDPPCEIYIDGNRSFITATSTISLYGNLIDNAQPAWSSFFFIYASRNSTGINFHFSPASPNVLTARKVTDTNSRYIATVRTLDATTDIAIFRQDGNRFYWSQNLNNVQQLGGVNNVLIPTTGLTVTPPQATSKVSAIADTNVTVPAHFQLVQLQYSASVNQFPAQCNMLVGYTATTNVVVIASGGHIGTHPLLIPLDGDSSPGTQKQLPVGYSNVQNCVTPPTYQITGWAEPALFYQ